MLLFRFKGFNTILRIHHQLINLLRLTINISIVFVAQNNNGKIILDKSEETGVIAMPPSIVKYNFGSICIIQHTPTQSLIFNPGLFKTVRLKGFLNG